MVRADGVADLGLLLELLGEAHAQQGVRQVGLFLGHLADIVQEAGALGDLRVQAQFGGHDGADVRDFAGVLQQVLAVGGTVFHAADQADELHGHPMDAEVDAGALAGLEDLVLELLLDLRHDFLDAGRMDAAVDHELVQGQAGDLAADRVEGGQHDGVRGVVHDDFHAGGGLQGADVAALAADDAALDLVIVDREGGDGVLDGRLRGGALDGVDDDALGFLRGVQAGFVDGVVDVGLGLGAGFGLHVLHQLGLGLLGRHPGDGLDLAVRLLDAAVALLLLPLEGVLLSLQGGLDIVHLLALAVQLAHLLVQGVLLLLHAGFRVADLGVLVVHVFLVLRLEVEELLLGLEDLVVLDLLRFDLGLLEDFVPLAPEDGFPDEYVGRQGQGGPDDESDE